MPELIKEGYVYLAQPPLYKLEKNKKVWYAYSDEELDNILNKTRASIDEYKKLKYKESKTQEYTFLPRQNFDHESFRGNF